MLTKITDIKTNSDLSILLTFSDGVNKRIDFKPFIGNDSLTSPLNDPAYFAKVKIYDNGRGIYWPNDFDFCPDYLHDLAM